MGEEFNLQAFVREDEEEAKQIRRQDYIPVVLYGPGVENKNLKVKKGDFERVYNQAGESSLINLKIGDEDQVKILVKDMQRDPIKDEIVHIDFYQVKMDEKISTEIPLEFVGESKVVKELGGYLEKHLDTVEVECLPGDLVHQIEVDISVLKTFDDEIKVQDLPVHKGVEIVTDPEEIVANVHMPKGEAEGAGEEEAPEEEAAGEEEGSESSEESQQGE